jgi:hypothetical protein
MKPEDPRQRRGPDPPAEVDRELSFHLDMRVRELIDQALSPEEAQRQALRPLATMTNRARRAS